MKETLHVIREGKSDPRLYFCPEEEASSALSPSPSPPLLFLLVASVSLSLSLDFLRSRQLPPAFLLNTAEDPLASPPPLSPRHLTIYPCLSLSLPLFPYLPVRQ